MLELLWHGFLQLPVHLCPTPGVPSQRAVGTPLGLAWGEQAGIPLGAPYFRRNQGSSGKMLKMVTKKKKAEKLAYNLCCSLLEATFPMTPPF